MRTLEREWLRSTRALLLMVQHRVIRYSSDWTFTHHSSHRQGLLVKILPRLFPEDHTENQEQRNRKTKTTDHTAPQLLSPWDWFQVRLCGTQTSGSSQSLFSARCTGKQLSNFQKTLYLWYTFHNCHYHVWLKICIWILALPLPESHWLGAFVCLCVFSSSCFN